MHSAAASQGLLVDSVTDAKASRAGQLSSRNEQPRSRSPAPAVEAPRPPSPPSASPAEPDDDIPAVPAHALSFEVCRHTGRLHVFVQDGASFKHLGSAAPAELVLASAAAAKHAFPFTSSAVRSAAAAFRSVWSSLKAVDQSVLWQAGKPLRLPLDGALQAARDVWKSAPSTIRTAKPIDVIPAPPAGSSGKEYVTLVQPGIEQLKYELHISAEGVWLCRGCSSQPARKQHPRDGTAQVCSLIDMFCSKDCHDRCVRCMIVRWLQLTRRRPQPAYADQPRFPAR